ncbi:MAG: hypothetical protein WA089_14700, partial [Anaerolineae bacterium]
MQPGVIIKIADGKRFDVSGRLLAEGTAGQPIIVTSLKDDRIGGDTNGDGNVTWPVVGAWESVKFTQTSGQSRLAHWLVRYGGSNSTTGALIFDSAAPTASYLTVMGSLYRGIYCNNSSPYLTALRLSANAVGFYGSTSCYGIVADSALYGNTQYAIQNANTTY